MKNLSSVKEVMYLKSFEDYVKPELLNWLVSRTKENKISVSVNENFDPEKKIWDGELFIDFMEQPILTDVVNNCIGNAYADEISMENNKKIRLWWD